MSTPQSQQRDDNNLSWVDDIVMDIIQTRNPAIQLDDQLFLDLLRESLSLDALAKRDVLNAVPRLVQGQFDELQKVFTEERTTLADLAKKYPDDIIKLVKKQKAEWKKLGEMFTMEKEAKIMKEQDNEEIEKLKKNLGI